MNPHLIMRLAKGVRQHGSPLPASPRTLSAARSASRFGALKWMAALSAWIRAFHGYARLGRPKQSGAEPGS